MASLPLFAVFAELDAVPLGDLEQLLKATMGVLAKARPESDVAELYASLGEGLTKRAYAAVAALVADMARLDAGAAQVMANLEENGLTENDKLTLFGQLFTQSKPAVRRELGKTAGVALPRLVDLEWRLDYVVRSSDPDMPPVPVYFVKLHVARPPKLDVDDVNVASSYTIDLSLSVEQMQDLLLTVRDANHQAARLATS